MTQLDNTSAAYDLADEWISIILSTNPELLVEKVRVMKEMGDGQPAQFNFEGITNRANALAEFRQQLGNALSAQHFTSLPKGD